MVVQAAGRSVKGLDLNEQLGDPRDIEQYWAE